MSNRMRQLSPDEKKVQDLQTYCKNLSVIFPDLEADLAFTAHRGWELFVKGPRGSARALMPAVNPLPCPVSVKTVKAVVQMALGCNTRKTSWGGNYAS